MSALYIHVPFCAQACYYCDFHFSTNLHEKTALVASICAEMRLQASFFSPEDLPLRTVYFGGGTPSLLSAGELQSLFETIGEVFGIAEGAEITLEANPNDLTEENLQIFRAAGINRLSIGIQSFHEPHLRFLHRNHTTEDSFACLERSRQAGFEKFTIDLIYGIPAPSHEIWAEDMRLAVGMGVNHISAYALTIEQRTVFGNWVGKGKMTAPDEDFQAEQMEMLMDFLPANGFEQYEISNFAYAGAYSRHNTHYWKQGAYLGVGASAHSYNKQARFWNVRNNAQYIASIKQGILPQEGEILSPTDHQNEYILTSLRTRWGCRLDAFANSPTHQKELDALHRQGLISSDATHIYLTRAGKLLADAVTEKLLF